MGRYIKFSSLYGISDKSSQKVLLGRIIAHYHVIEKGLSFYDMKACFGQSVINDLIHLLNTYIDLNYDKSNLHFVTACSVLNKYFNIHKSLGYDLDELKIKANKKIYQISREEFGGTKNIDKEYIIKSIDLDFRCFFESRSSIRVFSSEDVDLKKVYEALDIAQKYPSVCNRQAIRIYLIDDKEKIQHHLSYQNGTRGFTEQVNKLIVVTSDLSVFEGANERNQPFVDGGIYLMGLLLSLHSVGLGSVALNWCMDKKVDSAYRDFSGVKPSEVIIAFVAVGNLKDSITVPKSERSELNEILTVIK